MLFINFISLVVLWPVSTSLCRCFPFSNIDLSCHIAVSFPCVIPVSALFHSATHMQLFQSSLESWALERMGFLVLYPPQISCTSSSWQKLTAPARMAFIFANEHPWSGAARFCFLLIWTEIASSNFVQIDMPYRQNLIVHTALNHSGKMNVLVTCMGFLDVALSGPTYSEKQTHT